VSDADLDSDSDPELRESLDGDVALVTGANRGIGAEIAAGLSDRGATVYAGVRSSRYDLPGDQRRVFLDVTQRGDITRAVQQIREEAGRLDVLVNNAGVGGSSEPLHEIEAGDLDRTLGTNLRGPLLLSKAALPLLLETAAPRVVNLSSGMGSLRGMDGGSPAYRVSKAGLNGLTAYLHGKYREAGLLANAASRDGPDGHGRGRGLSHGRGGGRHAALAGAVRARSARRWALAGPRADRVGLSLRPPRAQRRPDADQSQ